MKAGSRVRGLAVTTIVILFFSLALVAPSAATPFARFTANVTSGPAPLTVAFTDRTYGWDMYPMNVSWAWDFGDGSTSSDPAPEHTFERPGGYLVRLVVTGDPLIAEPEATTTILVDPATLDASFDNETIGLTVRFTDTSIGGVTGWFWEFGDGATSNERNPDHTYAGSGNYTVRLGVSGRGDEIPRSTVEKAIVVEPTPTPAPARPPVAEFSFSPQNGTAPLLVEFEGWSSAPDGSLLVPVRWIWDFGDPGPTAEGRSVDHRFTRPGNYRTRLTVVFSGPRSPVADTGDTSLNVTAEHTVTVDEARLEIDAVGDIRRGDTLELTGWTSLAPGEQLLVEVFPSSYRPADKKQAGHVSGVTGTARVAGDGTDNTFRFAADTSGFRPDTYTATVRAVEADATATMAFALVERSTDGPTTDITTLMTTPPTLETPPPGSPPAAAFSWSVDAANVRSIQFTDGSTGDVRASIWNFGDGSTSTERSPPHVYREEGAYTVTLTVTGPGGTSTAAHEVRIGGTATPPVTPTVTETTVIPTVTEVTVTPTGTGGGGGEEFPWWLAAVVAVGLLAGGIAVAKGMGRRPPTPEERMPGLTIEARGGIRGPNLAGPPRRREAEVEIEVRGGMRRER